MRVAFTFGVDKSSNSGARQVSFNRTKIGGKSHNFSANFKQSEKENEKEILASSPLLGSKLYGMPPI